MRLRRKRKLKQKKQIHNLLKPMGKKFYDIIPPWVNNGKVIRERKSHIFPLDFGIIKTSVIKIVVLLLIVGLNWAGLSAVIETLSYYNNTENSTDNIFAAGNLDFELNSPADFYPVAISAGEAATRTISVVNLDNTPKYTVTATNFVGALCDYLNLEANLDGDGVEYSGKLTKLNYGPVVFEEPDNWLFTLTLPADAPESVMGETCNFNFVFSGSQIKNDLPFGEGFNDTEEINNNIAAKYCYNTETRSKGFWKNHESVYLPYLPQTLGDEIISTEAMVDQVFDDYNLSMRNKLRGQLLGMKFNVAHFGVGDYLVISEGKTINQIIAGADDLLRQDPEPEKTILKAMKDLLESLVDLQIKVCANSDVKVVTPNGGEVWLVDRNVEEATTADETATTTEADLDNGTTTEEVSTTTEDEQAPVIDEQPVVLPGNNSPDGIVPDNNSGDGATDEGTGGGDAGVDGEVVML